jgi:hypothetical protein
MYNICLLQLKLAFCVVVSCYLLFQSVLLRNTLQFAKPMQFDILLLAFDCVLQELLSDRHYGHSLNSSRFVFQVI